MSSKKIVQASFVTPGIEKIGKEANDFVFFGPLNIFFNFFQERKEIVCWTPKNKLNTAKTKKKQVKVKF